VVPSIRLGSEIWSWRWTCCNIHSFHGRFTRRGLENMSQVSRLGAGYVLNTFVGTGEEIFTLRDVQDSISSVSGCSLSPETLEKLGREDILQCPAIGGSRILFNRAFTSKFILFSISIHPAKHPTRHNSLGVVNEVAKAARHGFMRTMTYLRHSG